MVQLKSWARADTEHLNVSKTQEFINTKLLKGWNTSQLSSFKIEYPVSKSVTARWMKEAGFSYVKHKKSYYVDRHEDEDVIADRITYIHNFFSDEIYEHVGSRCHNGNMET